MRTPNPELKWVRSVPPYNGARVNFYVGGGITGSEFVGFQDNLLDSGQFLFITRAENPLEICPESAEDFFGRLHAISDR